MTHASVLSSTVEDYDMRHIYFDFQEEKLVQALAFFSLQGINDLTKLKAAKLLYFADKIHLNRYGRPITGDCYACMDKGPVPSISLNEMNEAICPDESSEPALLKVLEVRRAYYPFFALKDERFFDPEIFSRSELEVLKEVADSYGKQTAGQLIDLSHKEPAWLKANEGRQPGSSVPMPFESLFDQSNRDLLEVVMNDHREDAEWSEVLTCKH
jgi:uncharacterized phage-associated protein